ncbi:MAG TPA: glycoside hydrolase family 76 protein [Solirubrobacteraceae bacterium]|nr:glycoside hydrolase family 76 protein [Solirubrobacteraceae bacterium]
MEARFRRADGLYRRDGPAGRLGAAAHLWPFSQALAATLHLAGIAELAGSDQAHAADAALRRSLEALERYRDPCGAYGSDPPGRREVDVYYDDNAWVGLALVQLERLRPGAGWLHRAAELFAFATTGWDHRTDVPSPGGVFWLLQGRGRGRSNHDRNTVSTAPNAALGLHLRQLLGAAASRRAADEPAVTPETMCAWVQSALGERPGAPADGLFFDKIRGDGSVDRTLWSYNQGSMVAVEVLLARGAAGQSRALHLGRAEAIARRALDRWGRGWQRQPPAFIAITMRNLLMLHGPTGDGTLRERISGELAWLSDLAWDRWRGRGDLFSASGSGAATLLDQSAAVQLLALACWPPELYDRLA